MATRKSEEQKAAAICSGVASKFALVFSLAIVYFHLPTNAQRPIEYAIYPIMSIVDSVKAMEINIG